MAKDTNKAGRRATSRVNISTRGLRWRDRVLALADQEALGWGLLACVVFIAVVGALTAWTIEQPRVAVGQIMRDTRLARVEFRTEDIQRTEMQREAARQNTPRIYAAERPVLDELRTSIANLPLTLAGVESLDQVDQDIRQKFGLSADLLAAVRLLAQDEAGLAAWQSRVAVLDDILRRRPMLSGQGWQRVTQEGLSPQIELRGVTPDQTTRQFVSRDEAINIENAEMLRREVERIVFNAGFEAPLDELVRKRLANTTPNYTPRPTFAFDASATNSAQQAAADRVEVVGRTVAVGQKIYGRGETLDADQLSLFQREREEFVQRGGLKTVMIRRAGIFGFVAVLTVLMAGYISAFCPKIAQRPARVWWLTLTLILAIGSACVFGVFDPRLMWLASLTPVILVTVLLCVAYDQRTSLAVGSVMAVFVAMALGLHVGMLALMVVGIASAVSQLREIRERRTLIRMSFAVAMALCGAAMLDQLIELPSIGPSGTARTAAILSAGAQSFLSGLLVGGIALFILPFVEKAFDITTGMTLIELRDPKQPLLRELQQRAPGTYNHSLNVASIAESAAESIGADSLLTYVGCLYHDIGKMNKPQYFVENQSGGQNKHDKLNPAMSLLVIVGHVKDGMEIARKHNLPRSLRHFIEGHHGTTLVEYFFRRAVEKAERGEKNGKGPKPEAAEGEKSRVIEGDDDRLPSESDYRYPGPRPRTKEVAITMLSDAVESATRTLAEPTPSRIDALVRDLANRRLMDGQFDECDLTLRELSTICDSISKSVASIYHGRVRYASTSGDPARPDTRTGTGDTKRAEATRVDTDPPTTTERRA
ncbi:HD family phosphohydrolase [Nodularia spumigena]|uniref:HD family phosphohydrolase n=1 Tax=Nodularia spumigena TaxID=70799 RepID=UPI002B1FABAF|nr:HDIG domain-containing metalloprotein [Nodularia spumigena]MEA5615431.1 HDIG domain-containing protein [Nodularia spumigena UHCC 0040]